MASATKSKANKNAYRRAQKKAKREATVEFTDTESESGSTAQSDISTDDAPAVKAANLIDVEDFADVYDFDNPLIEQYKGIFEKFKEKSQEEVAKQDNEQQPEMYLSDDDIPEEEEEVVTVSKKQRKMMNTLSVAQLKSLVQKPELVEWTDVSSSDPELLLAIKACKNVIPVPTHWSLKREYLSSKRGIEKPPFTLPKFIQETGISEMRDAVLEKQAEMTMRQKQRERVQGKLGKLDIDYAKLYDAFFRRQTKPEMTKYGEVYYEGKEYETNLVNLKPGEISDELKDALNIPPGFPPPWLINMQRFGPSPAYPNLRVPGVNAAIPPGASWGFSSGQWGKPPTDDAGKPLFGGDLYGTSILEEQQQPTHHGEPIERSTWGALRAEGESDEEDEDDDDEDEEDDDEDEEADASGTQTSAGIASAMPSEMGGTESIGGEFTLRKQRRGFETEEPSAPRSAHQVIPERNISATGFFGGEHAYDLDAARRDTIGQHRKRKAGEVDVSVDVDQLAQNDKLDRNALKKEYESRQKAEMQGEWQSIDQDDLANMIQQESRKRAKVEDQRRNRR